MPAASHEGHILCLGVHMCYFNQRNSSALGLST